ncbi:lumazine synthase [Mycoemilia scoparia]|uniref:6,7-dimethyl-8-ribityllumazine synthase n=1 Tax=Mycoemilia scoparia TaxID=417184 RepID=A0A9W7ZZG7_9FUNG|nr:lumazine synthase [Mycoemilia scoparia]
MAGKDFVKGVKESSQALDGSNLRVLIVHARWNSEIITPLVEGAKKTMIEKYKVKPENIVLKDVPGAYELPSATQILLKQSQQQLVPSNDLLSMGINSPQPASSPAGSVKGASSAIQYKPFDVAICIGVLIKGSTMHFEYIADATSNGIMRVSLDTGIPCIFGVLTCLTDEQAKERAGIAGQNQNEGHNHGADWGAAAVEMALLKL